MKYWNSAFRENATACGWNVDDHEEWEVTLDEKSFRSFTELWCNLAVNGPKERQQQKRMQQRDEEHVHPVLSLTRWVFNSFSAAF